MPEGGPRKAMLANLRRGIGLSPGELPEIWGLIFADMPEEMLSTDGTPTRAEWAVYTALTLFALHQQGHDPEKEPMTRAGQALGIAVRGLVPIGDEDALKRIQRRFNAFATASGMDELVHHLRGLVQLLRAEGIPLDYPALAEDIFRYQFPEMQSSVRLKWGQDFYRLNRKDQNDNEGKGE
ncbi:MAG: type I-E CRISPR-associated protein Cse2/CasB [Lentisphaerae bacterium]|nr:type I-E CRISPR-associated protein Cse2/CasB [Lentisphaerota bacterium]